MVNVLLVSQRLDLLEQWLGELRRLAHLAPEAFYADSRNPAAAESYLRRCLEAIFDVGISWPKPGLLTWLLSINP